MDTRKSSQFRTRCSSQRKAGCPANGSGWNCTWHHCYRSGWTNRKLRKSFFSFCYRLIRFITTKILYIFQWLLLKPLDLEPAVIFGDKNLALLSRMTPFVFNYRIPAGIEVELYDLKFPSPLTGASFKSETDILGIWLTMGLGSVTLKTIMECIRTGN